MRTVRRPRRYIDRQWLILLRPALRYSRTRDAYVLRGVGHARGPVLRVDRRDPAERGFQGIERRRRASVA